MQISSAPQVNGSVLSLAPNEQYEYSGRRITTITIADGNSFQLNTQTGSVVDEFTAEHYRRMTPHDRNAVIPSPHVRATLAAHLYGARYSGTTRTPPASPQEIFDEVQDPQVNEALRKASAATPERVLDFNAALQRAVTEGRRHR